MLRGQYQRRDTAGGHLPREVHVSLGFSAHSFSEDGIPAGRAVLRQLSSVVRLGLDEYTSPVELVLEELSVTVSHAVQCADPHIHAATYGRRVEIVLKEGVVLTALTVVYGVRHVRSATFSDVLRLISRLSILFARQQ